MNSYKVSIFAIKILSFFVLGKKYRKTFRNALNKKFKIEYRKNLKLQEYLKKYTVIQYQEQTHEFIQVNELPIWQLWLQGENQAPEIVKRCLESVKKYAGGRKVFVLTQDNISDYIDIPEFIWEKKKQGIISNTHFSDILRICLLEKYGGTWIDATVYLTDEISHDILEQDFFAFSVPENHINYGVHLFSSWFIHAQPGHIFSKCIKKSIFSYWENENQLVDYFTFHLLAYNVIKFNSKLNCIWDKGLDVENILPHKLQFILKDNYSVERLIEIKKEMSVHKLTYKIKNDVPGTFLDVFLKKGF
ncbi:capsular polysaccharide synthesis protein [Acinetobacter schindleri]|uniref:capsular polysaccharide synthesis protein n=1 Tax=Acinetobacter TaxID=469 RepID=UPI0008F45FEF|nr:MULTISPECIES: capsular polysaccharide synthesis protein [Acinetobacter]OIJ38252.1 hypothetical protein BK820_06205 [Acinetobacter sp. LCT-H3]